MQQKKEHKEGHLRQLEELVKLENVGGKEHANIMRFIGNQYPLEFIRFMKKHRGGKVRLHKDMLDECLPTAIEIVNNMYMELQKFFIYPPQSEKDKKEYDRLIEKLEELILKQTKEN